MWNYKDSSSSILDSDSMNEWTPISSRISPGSRDYFNFEVNSNSTGLSSTYEMLIFLSGNICSQSTQNSSDLELKVFYSFNESVTTNPEAGNSASFVDGYMEALAIRPLTGNVNVTQYSDLFLMVEVVNSTTGQEASATDAEYFWNYTISVSQNDLVFQWDSRAWLEVVDTDYNTALLVTGNVTSTSTSASNYSIYDTSLYDLFIYSYDYVDYFDNILTHSLCAVKNGPYLVSSVNSKLSGNLTSINETELAIGKSITVRGGSVKEQFYVTGLNSSATYVAYLTKKISSDNESLSDSGGILFSKVTFTTMIDDSCSLIFGLDFCDGVAYSVPTSSLAVNNKTQIATLYDDIAKSLYANFSNALMIIPCNAEKDATFSPLRSCNDCATAYRNWLCAVSIPRCTTSKTSYYIHREKTDNRNDYINSQIQPISDYYEILPCINMCYSLVVDCPPDFGFACPSENSHSELLYLSYNVYENDLPYDTCNYVGNSNSLKILD